MSAQRAVVKYILSAKSNIAEWVSSHRLWSVGIAVELVAVIYVFLLVSNSSIANAITSATIRQPEPVTELYFNNYLQLPATYKTGQHQSFQFSIHNLEGQQTTYSYIVNVNGVPMEPPQSITIANDATKQIPETISINASVPRVEVEVVLVNINQSIHYWTAKE